MKKTVSLILIVALLGGAYTASAWFMGKRTKQVIDQQYKFVQALPYAKVVKRDYRRGIFSSEETVTFAFFGKMLRTAAKARAANGQPAALPGNFDVTVHTRIMHGPFPGFATLAAAVGESTLVLPANVKKRVAPIAGGKKLLSCRTVFHFDGETTSTVKSPGATVSLPSVASGGTVSLVWDAFEARIDTAPDLRHYTMRGRIPRIEIKGEKDVRLTMSNLRFAADQKRIYADEPLLFSGTELFTVDEVRISKANGAQPPVTLKQLKYDIEAPCKGDFLDVAVKMGVEKILVENKKFGPAHFDYSFKHLHARTVASISHDMLKRYANPQDFTRNPRAAAAMVLAPLLGHAKALLEHKPEFAIDRISFVSPAGEARLAAKVKLNGTTPADFNNPALLLTKLEASGDVSIPEAMLIGMVGKNAQKKERILQRIARFREMGYITDENHLIKTHAEFKQGQLKLNGNPFPPGHQAARQQEM